MDFLQTAADFISKYFVEPIDLYQGYNPINTFTYAIILFGISFFLLFPWLHRKGIKFNLRFMLALFPYIFLATGIRILEDLLIIKRASLPWEIGYYFVSPGIWIATALLVVVCLLIAKRVSNIAGKDPYLIFGLIGLILWLPVLVLDLFLFKRWLAFAEVIAAAAILTALAFVIMRLLKNSLLKDRLNLLAVASQTLDGTATAIATSLYGYGEQHFVSAFILGINPFLFVIIKMALAIVILSYVEKDIENENLRNFIKVVLIILGSATGSRDALTLAAGSNLY